MASTLTRSQVRKILKRNRGEMQKIATDLEIKVQTVSGVLRGKGDSKPVLEACTIRAGELLAAEGATESNLRVETEAFNKQLSGVVREAQES